MANNPTSKTVLRNGIRTRYMSLISDFLKEKGEEVLVTGSNEIALPCVDADGNDEYIVITFKVPTGSRDGEPYDGHSVAEYYAFKRQQSEEKKFLAAQKKAAKIAADKAAREAKAAAKAKKEGA